MDKPLVSIGIPVYNGEKYLTDAIESLLAQDYENIELIILDNISTDATADICRRYADKDRRLRFIVDSERVGDPEGHHRVIRYAMGDYFMLACDDDVYEPSYVSELMSLLSHDGAAMAYSGFNYIYDNGTVTPVEMRDDYFFSSGNSMFKNFAFYLLHRAPVPLQFGLMRTELHKESLTHFHRVDKLGDHDNLYMLKLLSTARVASIRQKLFNYRQKDRSHGYPDDYPATRFGRYCYQALHQLRVARAISSIIDEAAFTSWEKLLLRGYNWLVTLCNMTFKEIVYVFIKLRMKHFASH